MSQTPLIKCCGFRDIDSLNKLKELDVDLVGFILAPSKRRVPTETLRDLLEAVPEGMKKVGVFVNPSFEELEKLFVDARLDIIQLHGQESPEFCKEAKQRFSTQIIKAVHIGAGEGELPSEEYGPWIDYLLLDTFDTQAAGGTGKTFRWDVIPTYHKWCDKYQVKLLVAGGITPENVQELVGQWPLDGIDVASGIETEGSKDRNKIERLVKGVKKHGGSS